MVEDIQKILLGYLENVLGKSKSTARNNHAFMCPNGCHPTKPKLEINLNTYQYQCWICGGEKNGYQGKNLVNLLKKANAPLNIIKEVQHLIKNKNTNFTPQSISNKIELPKEYIPLYPHNIISTPG